MDGRAKEHKHIDQRDAMRRIMPFGKTASDERTVDAESTASLERMGRDVQRRATAYGRARGHI